MSQMNGTVKWFNDTKGFGFLQADSGEEVFVHYSSIKSDGFRSLKDGQKVTLDVVDDKRGKKADNVVVVA